MNHAEYTAAFPFGGLGGGALGFAGALVRAFGVQARFRIVGGFDFDAAACRDFAALTGAHQECADVTQLSTAEVRAVLGDRAPDVAFMSPPCKGASGLSRAGEMLADVVALLTAAGYVCSDGFHDCGEIGGLAQRRRRYLLVARHARRSPPLLYQPPRKRVRACGEVLGELPMPEDAAGGDMHRMPRLSWRNWVRLALIPAGGDWRDLPGVLDDGQKRRERFKRHAVEPWDRAVGTIGGPGSNGVENVADPRVKRAFDHGYAVLPWTAPSFTIAGKSHPGNGAYSVADPRLACTPRNGAYGVIPWNGAAPTITGSACIDNGRFAVADPRRPPDTIPVITAADGTWHRPLTTLELAVLQGFPATVRGAPLQLDGRSTSAHRERIGNAVPPPAARAIAETMLVNLVAGDHGGFSLSNDPVWVREDGDGAPLELAGAH